MVLDYIKIYNFNEDLLEDSKKYADVMLPALTGGGKTSIRTCSEKYFHPANPEDNSTDFYKKVENIVSDVTRKYVEDVPVANKSLIQKHTGFHLLRYQHHEKYGEHVDDFNHVFRRLSITLNLNDQYTGGNFVVCGKVFNLKRNECLVFPSNFCFPHEISPVTHGERWSIVTWII